MIRIGCHSENFGALSPEETFFLLSKMGFRYIDVAARSLIPQEKILADPDGAAAMLRSLRDRYGVLPDELFLDAVEVNGKKLQPALPESDCDALYRNLDAICRFAKLAGFYSVMGAPGVEVPTLGYEKSFENAARVLAKQVKVAAERGVAFHVEPSRASLMNTPDRAIRMIEAAPGLKYTLDFLHYQIQGIPQEDSMRLIPHAGHLHARQAATVWGKCPYEFGEIDYDAIVKRLRAHRWQGGIALEFWCDDVMTADGIDAVEHNILMRYELKRLIRKYGA